MNLRVEGFRRKRPEEIARMATSGRILGECLGYLSGLVVPGVTALDIDREAEQFIRDHGCIPGFIGYNDFPKSICISVNDEVVHGVPGDRPFEDGDLVSLDCGLILAGWWADSGCSVVAGTPTAQVTRLIDITREALERGIQVARPGNHIGDIGHAVQSWVEGNGYSVVRNYVGHGIGRDMHEPPQVPNYGASGTGNQLKPGYVLAIEPMVNVGTAAVHTRADGHTVVTSDGKLSCYFEHTVAITEDGPVVLTRRPGEVDAMKVA